MKKFHFAAIPGIVAVMLTVQTAMAASQPVSINASWGDRHWMTIRTNEVSLAWEWPAEAACARLEINGMNSAFMTNFTEVTTEYLWCVFETPQPAAEDVYDLSLTFLDENELNVTALTSRLAVVSGAFGPTTVHTAYDNQRWERIGNNAIIPYDASWMAATDGATASQLTIAKEGGSTHTNTLSGASGYTDWKLKGSDWGYGSFYLSLAFPGVEGEWDALLARVPSGIIMHIR